VIDGAADLCLSHEIPPFPGYRALRASRVVIPQGLQTTPGFRGKVLPLAVDRLLATGASLGHVCPGGNMRTIITCAIGSLATLCVGLTGINPAWGSCSDLTIGSAPNVADNFTLSNGHNVVTLGPFYADNTTNCDEERLYVLGQTQDSNNNYHINYYDGSWTSTSSYVLGFFVDYDNNAYAWGVNSSETNVWTGSGSTWTEMSNYCGAASQVASVFETYSYTNLWANIGWSGATCSPNCAGGGDTGVPGGTGSLWLNPPNEWESASSYYGNPGMAFGTQDKVSGQQWALGQSANVWTWGLSGGTWQWLEMTTSNCTTRDDSFVQIAAKNNIVYALDSGGVVWYDDYGSNGTGGCWSKIDTSLTTAMSIATDNCAVSGGGQGLWLTTTSGTYKTCAQP
jgi:hypothetical protein